MKLKTFISVINWQKSTFGPATSKLSKLQHLKDEIKELEADIKTNNPAKALEFADCFILLYGAAHDNGMSFDDIDRAINIKMEINKNRTWSAPDKRGVCNHIDEDVKDPTYWGYLFLAIIVAVLAGWAYLVQILSY